MTVRPSTKHDIQRDDENTSRPGFAVVQKILVTGSIFAESTGADSGTGDVRLEQILPTMPLTGPEPLEEME